VVTVMKEIEAGEPLWQTKDRKRAEKEQRKQEQKAALDQRARDDAESALAEQAQPDGSTRRRPGFY